ncbi:hypothetical protein [Moritella viscosa]|uniref:Deoxyribose-phosphate aldolase-2-deoxy-D-ribose 5-phosphate aldolase-Phosphodeoxyriboaldolase n=1 Tax=Moritella viscosa TaxID=80854 RepID=A0A1L0AMG1_9GAMM|nr:hypothetical protein [Moritella viscosa]SGZ17440.1 Deoxyribose-phosphate aldolase-2-deoxy-D-ribose 5-phosphate aldolase-Phosphodeoxyriboaldolase [Moritella viscosa]
MMNFPKESEMQIETLTEYMDNLIAQSKHKKLLKESRETSFANASHEPTYTKRNKSNIKDYIKTL